MNTEGGTAIPGLLGALLIVLNIRLGSWLANPRYLDEEGSLPRRPLFAPLFLLREWLRTNSEDDPAVFVSDGGHEDNLGLSALVERGCPLVICLDATADAAGTFKDLNTAIRCLSLRGWALKVEKGAESPWLALVAKPGEIVLNTTVTLDFEHATSPATSRVIYTRSNLTVEASKDARAYQKTNAAFPQDSTADQWFDELQFDAYVAVGEGLAEHVTARVKLELARKRREEAQKDKVA